MCFELDSLPPIPPLSGGAPVRSEDLTLRAADGNAFAAFAAIPDEPAPVGVVVLPDVRGLYHFYEELALRFGERGYPAVAFDYFGRTAGVAKRNDEFRYMDHVALTTPEGIQQDVQAAVEYLRSPAGGSCTEIFTVGFCFGGRSSWLAAAGGHGLAGAIGFYGSTGERNGAPGPTQRADELRRRSSHSRRATTPTSFPSTMQPSTPRSLRRASSTRWSSTTALRTASSTASSRSTQTPLP